MASDLKKLLGLNKHEKRKERQEYSGGSTRFVTSSAYTLYIVHLQ